MTQSDQVIESAYVDVDEWRETPRRHRYVHGGRLWWVEHAPHGAPQILGPALTPLKDSGVWKSRLVDYDGVTAQALRDLVEWVEDGIAPPPSTGYSMTSTARSRSHRTRRIAAACSRSRTRPRTAMPVRR